jgi:protein-S-isoprenylcysteine O-methyltransferase Ste14
LIFRRYLTDTFDWIAAVIVIVSLVYVSFVLTLAEWLAALRKGQAVTLLPERKGRKWPMWAQIGMVVLGMVLCAVMFYYLWIPLPLSISASAARVLGVIGLAVYLEGCAFMLWARRTLGRMWGLSTSQQVKLLDDHELIQSGPFAFVRHPMYFGWWAAMLGLTLLYPTWMVFILFLSSLIAFAGRARREEAVLAERFGDQWTAYKAHTKFLIPFIY